MKILQVVPYFYPAWAYGGPAKLVYDTSLAFLKRGHIVDVFTSDAYDQFQRMPDSKKIRNVQGLQVKYFRNFSNQLAFKYNIYLPLQLILHVPLHLHRYDVIHLHDFYTLANVWIFLWATLYGKPYICSVHGCLEMERKKQKSIFKNVFLQLFGKALLKRARFVVATSQNEREAYLQIGVSKNAIRWIGHAVEEKEFQSKKSKKSCREFFNLDTTDIVFTFIGRIHKIKGLDLLLEAIRKIPNGNVQFVIAGSDEGFLNYLLKKVSEYKLSKKVRFHGPIFGKQKADLFNASDVFIYPSRSEGFSLGILEAAVAGLPLILTSACNFPEIGREKAGEITHVQTSSLRKAIIKMANLSSSEREKMGNRARKFVLSNYSKSKILRSLENMYKDAASSTP